MWLLLALMAFTPAAVLGFRIPDVEFWLDGTQLPNDPPPGSFGDSFTEDLGTVRPLESASLAIVVKNVATSGGSTVFLNSAECTGGIGLAAFTVDRSRSYMTDGDEATVTVTFRPQAVGVFECELWLRLQVDGIGTELWQGKVLATADEDADEDGVTALGGDCDDADPRTFPGNPEVCDGKDNDCDGNVPPEEVEVCDGLDNDCDGVVDPGCEDLDADGFFSVASGGDDCDDGDSGVHPGALERCGDSVDQDCDGVTDADDTDCTDADNDGFFALPGGDDCDDTSASVYPGGVEICGDFVDNDCDGYTDEEECQDTAPPPPSHEADPAFPYYGNALILPDTTPGIVGITSTIAVTVFNEGAVPTGAFVVELAFSDWGVTYMGWQSIGVLPYGAAPIAPAATETQTFSHVFANRAHTCLQARISNTAPGENAETTNDRTQLNWEVVHADGDYSMQVPFGNAADEAIVVDNVSVGCLVDGSLAPCFGLDADGNPAADEPTLVGAPSALGANEEVVATVNMTGIAPGGMVVVVQASLNGEVNNVMISVVATTVSALLNEPHLCCIASIKTRVLLETMLADALTAYEDGECRKAIKLLRLAVQKTILLECDLSDAEIACAEKAILKLVDAAIIIAREKGAAANGAQALQEAHFFRRAGLYEAALLEAAKAC